MTLRGISVAGPSTPRLHRRHWCVLNPTPRSSLEAALTPTLTTRWAPMVCFSHLFAFTVSDDEDEDVDDVSLHGQVLLTAQ